jgi:hypothetical protein
MEEIRERERERERERNQCPEAIPSLVVAKTNYLLLLLTLCFRDVFFRPGL